MSAEPEPVVVDCDLEAAPDQVWRALTEPDLLALWLAEAADKAEVVESRPGERLHLAWRERDEAGALVESDVTFTLTPIVSGGTRLRLVHDGFVRTPIMARAMGALPSALHRRPAPMGGLAWAA
jgi:uncharacterized protein YndB with AHSA1/START domain